MNIKFSQLLEMLRASFWFIPSVMVVSAIILSFLTLELDSSWKYELIGTFGWTYVQDAEGSRATLSTIAGSMVSVTTTAFSIVIVALQLASSQLGPRLLRNFIRDRGNQIVLGTFIATFVYSLLILRTIRAEEDRHFLPQISVTLAVVLAILSLGVLIYFIHHTAESIQADHVIAEVSDELHKAITRLFPEELGQGKPEHRNLQADIPTDFNDSAYPISVQKQGYFQTIDEQQLIEIAQNYNLVLRLNYRPGDFLMRGDPLIEVWPRDEMNKDLAQKFEKTFIIDSLRTQQQDIKFVVDQLVEIASRALSPGLNDPFTAIRCIDRLGAALSYLAQRKIPSPYRYDEQNHLRIIAYPVTFSDITNTAFNQIRQYGCSHPAVVIRLLETLSNIAFYTQDSQAKAALRRHADAIKSSSLESILEEGDRRDIEEKYKAVLSALADQTLFRSPSNSSLD